MPTLRRLRPADHRVMPWKNGLGTTTEIAVHPPGSALDAFTWRISVADLAASGPFSTFAGYDRVLVQIEGAPMTLSHAGGDGRRLLPLAPYPFPGELATHATLDAPPARDFNVMVRRDRASAAVSGHDLPPGATARDEGDAPTRCVYVLRGEVSVDVDGERADVLAGEALLVAGAASLVVTAGAEGAAAILVAIGAPR